MRKILALAFAALALAACSKSPPPAGRWEGTYAGGGTFVAARLEIEPDGTVRVSAPDVTGPDLEPADRAQMEANMAERLAGAWGEIAPRRMDFDGTTFRKPGGIAPQIDWDAASKTMTLYVYIGTQPALKIPLRPVADFSDNPWPQ
jgi:putative VirB-like lipoprotein